MKYNIGRDNRNTSKDGVSFKTLKEEKNLIIFEEKKPSDVYLPQSWRKASVSEAAITRAAISDRGWESRLLAEDRVF